jgi:hypothetical protein
MVYIKLIISGKVTWSYINTNIICVNIVGKTLKNLLKKEEIKMSKKTEFQKWESIFAKLDYKLKQEAENRKKKVQK